MSGVVDRPDKLFLGKVGGTLAAVVFLTGAECFLLSEDFTGDRMISENSAESESVNVRDASVGEGSGVSNSEGTFCTSITMSSLLMIGCGFLLSGGVNRSELLLECGMRAGCLSGRCIGGDTTIPGILSSSGDSNSSWLLEELEIPLWRPGQTEGGGLRCPDPALVSCSFRDIS